MVRLAGEVGLAAIAITDHDSMEGVPEGIAAGERFGVEVVPGVEMSTDGPNSEEVHILGYFLEADPVGLRAVLQAQKESRLRRLEQMLARLRQIGVMVPIQHVLKLARSNGAVGRPHLAQAMVEIGYVANIAEAFERYLDEGRPAYLPRRRLRSEQAIAAIRQAGGVPVLAHPGLSHCSEEAIHQWVKVGLRGIEVAYSQHTSAQETHYRELANALGLIATAGSDFHGLSGEQMGLGARTCDFGTVKRLREEARRIRQAGCP